MEPNNFDSNENISDIRTERRLLNEERMKLEDRLLELRSPQSTHTDESFDDIFNLAMQMKSDFQIKVDSFEVRREEVSEEQKWIQTNPNTELWRDLERRLKRNPSDSGEESYITLSSEIVASYFAAGKESDEIKALENDHLRKERIIKEIRNSIIDETVGMFVKNISKYFMNITIAAKLELGNAVCLSITDSQETLNNADQLGTQCSFISHVAYVGFIFIFLQESINY